MYMNSFYIKKRALFQLVKTQKAKEKHFNFN